MGFIVTNANTPSGTRALLTPDMYPTPFGVQATTGPLNVSLPGGSATVAEGELSSANGQAINLRGYTSPTKPSFNRPLVGDDVVNGVLTVLNDDKTYDLVLAGGVWTATRK